MNQPTGPLPPKLHGLDHLRALAITLVFLFHYGGIFPHPGWMTGTFSFGWTGVDLFFVLSGYLIASQLFVRIASGKKISLREFFIKRFFRIIPAYTVVVAIYFLLPSFRERTTPPAPLWKFLTFTQNLDLDIAKYGSFTHAWSLCIEEQFYLLLPLILVIMVSYRIFRKGYIVLIALFIIGLALRIFSWYSLVIPMQDTDHFTLSWLKWIYYPTYCRLDGLLVGVSIAAIYQFRQSWRIRIERLGNYLFLLGIATFVGAYFIAGDQVSFRASAFGYPLVALGFGLILMGAISPRGILFNFHSPVLSRIATLSYAIYLSHKITIHLTQTQLSRTGLDRHSTIMFLACVITSILVGLLLNQIIEKPFLRLRERILRTRRQSSQLASVKSLS